MNKPLVLPPEKQGRAWLAELLGHHPEAAFLGAPGDTNAWFWVPGAVRQGFLKQAFLLAKAFAKGTSSELATLRSMVALDWELRCLRGALDANEVLSGSAQTVKTSLTGYSHYTKGQRPTEEPGLAEERLRLQNDVPILRECDGKSLPYLLECKNAQTHPFGQDFGININAPKRVSLGAMNQLLRYQTAIAHGLVAGASVEIAGRIHPVMLQWMLEGLDGKGSRIPDVEVVWSCPLPSGGHHRVRLKAGKGEGLPVAECSSSDPRDHLALESLTARLGHLAQLQEVCLGAPRLEEVSDPRCHALLGQTVTSQAGYTFRAIDRPWEIQDVATWRAFVDQSRQQAARLLTQTLAQHRPSRGPSP